MARENKSRYAILGLLSSSPMSGYDIKKKIEELVSNFWTESYGQIYPILKQLVAEGLATRSTEAQAGKPDRYIYTLTDLGHEELCRWLIEPTEPQVERIEVLIKLAFGSAISVADNIRHVEQFRKLHQQQLQKYEALAERFKAYCRDNSDLSPNLPYWLMAPSYGMHVSQALISWCDETLTVLSGLDKDVPGDVL
ncbi:MAG: PadR family transcriptional regulator, partial [Gemmatimonadaceae bacterium]|nr:PadR family transcriptional regulator [Gloeobacterales cyanobacterium ES-bin-141]